MGIDSDGGGHEPPAWARRADIAPSGWREGRGGRARPRVAIVGPCAAGKTTLVSNLRALGYDAHAPAQEHSYVPYLWQLGEPDVLLFLDATREAVSVRRRTDWPQTIHEAQQGRLAHARAHADLYLDGSTLTPDEVAEHVARFLAAQDSDEREATPGDPGRVAG